MRGVLAVVCLALVVLLPGCIVQSLHPLCTEEQLVFEPGLVGVWEQGGEGGTALTFERGEGKMYRLTWEERGETARLVARLVKLGGTTYLDLTAESFDEAGDQLVDLPLVTALHLVPVHSFWRIQLEGDELGMAMLNVEWLCEQIKEGKVVIEHEPVEDEEDVIVLLLTAETEDLQKLLVDHGDDPDAFLDPGRFERRGE